MRSDSYNFTHPFLRKIESFEQDSICLIAQFQSHTYGELLDSTRNALNLLNDIKANSVIGIIGDYALKTLAFFLACVEKGFIVTPLSASLIPKDSIFSPMLQSYIKEGQINYLFYNNTLHPTHNTDKKHSIVASLQANHTSGLILFSSGSTGKPKAIVHNLNTLLESYCNKRQNPLRIMSVYLPDHIAGIDVMLNTFGSGGSLIIPKERSPQWILESLQKHKVEILPASPTLLRLLLVAGLSNYDLTHLKLVIYGSEKMSSKLLESLQQALPHTRFKQSFGTSETNAIKTKQADESDFAEFFRIINADYKIVDNILYLTSHTNALGYLNSDNSVFDDKGYFATGDLVEVKNINGEEYIKIIGRAKEVINVGGEKVIPQEVEGVLLQIPFISDCVVYGESNAITGQSVSVKVVLDSNHYIKSSKAESANLESSNSKIVSEKCGLQGKSQGSYLSGNDRSDFSQLPHLSPQAELPKETTQNLELKKYIRTFCKDKLAPFKIPSKVSIVESLEVSERFKRIKI